VALRETWVPLLFEGLKGFLRFKDYEACVTYGEEEKEA